MVNYRKQQGLHFFLLFKIFLMENFIKKKQCAKEQTCEASIYTKSTKLPISIYGTLYTVYRIH